MTEPAIDLTFRANWTAEILQQRPMILPARQHVYPTAAEEVERGALEVLVKPAEGSVDTANVQPFLATCALGFRDPSAPTGLWSMPNPDWLCAVSGGYAYLVDVTDPSRFVFVRYRPVLQVLPVPQSLAGISQDLILFAEHHSILAWGREGEAWETGRLSWEGLTELRIEQETSSDGTPRSVLHGMGWDMPTDREIPFSIDINTGQRI